MSEHSIRDEIRRAIEVAPRDPLKTASNQADAVMGVLAPVLARAETAEAARDENYAKYRAATVANEEWHQEVTALRARLAETVKQRDALMELLPLLVTAGRDGYGHHCGKCEKCAALARAEAILGMPEHPAGCWCGAEVQAVTTQRDTKQEAP